LSGDLGAPVDRERLHLLLSDLLQQLEGQADPFLDEVLQRHGVRGLRVVGPLLGNGYRSGFWGLAGRVETPRRKGDRFEWSTMATMHPDSRVVRGTAPTRLAADRALCLTLRELGWAPVEVPPEPLEHLVELPPGFVEVAPEFVEMADSAENALHYSAEDVEQAGVRIAAAERAYNEWQTRIASLNRRLSYGADAFLRLDGVRVEWRGEEGVVTCTIPRHLLLAVGQEAVASRFARWVEFVRTRAALGAEPAWVEGCELEITHRPRTIEFAGNGQPRTVTFILGEDDRL
jgi:hypothetical protein